LWPVRCLLKLPHKVTMRGIPGSERPRPGDTVLFGDRALRIESVLDIEERGRELVLMCKEKLGEVSTASVEQEPNGSG